MTSTPPKASARRFPDDDAVAWELAAVAHPHLNRVDADRIYIAIGVGDAFEAIEALLTTVVRNRIPVGLDLVSAAATWLDCYHGRDTEPRLRHLLAQVNQVLPPRTSDFDQRFGSALIAARDRRP